MSIVEEDQVLVKVIPPFVVGTAASSPRDSIASDKDINITESDNVDEQHLAKYTGKVQHSYYDHSLNTTVANTQKYIFSQNDNGNNNHISLQDNKPLKIFPSSIDAESSWSSLEIKGHHEKSPMIKPALHAKLQIKSIIQTWQHASDIRLRSDLSLQTTDEQPMRCKSYKSLLDSNNHSVTQSEDPRIVLSQNISITGKSALGQKLFFNIQEPSLFEDSIKTKASLLEKTKKLRRYKAGIGMSQKVDLLQEDFDRNKSKSLPNLNGSQSTPKIDSRRHLNKSTIELPSYPKRTITSDSEYMNDTYLNFNATSRKYSNLNKSNNDNDFDDNISPQNNNSNSNNINLLQEVSPGDATSTGSSGGGSLSPISNQKSIGYQNILRHYINPNIPVENDPDDCTNQRHARPSSPSLADDTGSTSSPLSGDNRRQSPSKYIINPKDTKSAMISQLRLRPNSPLLSLLEAGDTPAAVDRRRSSPSTTGRRPSPAGPRPVQLKPLSPPRISVLHQHNAKPLTPQSTGILLAQRKGSGDLSDPSTPTATIPADYIPDTIDTNSSTTNKTRSVIRLEVIPDSLTPGHLPQIPSGDSAPLGTHPAQGDGGVLLDDLSLDDSQTFSVEQKLEEEETDNALQEMNINTNQDDIITPSYNDRAAPVSSVNVDVGNNPAQPLRVEAETILRNGSSTVGGNEARVAVNVVDTKNSKNDASSPSAPEMSSKISVLAPLLEEPVNDDIEHPYEEEADVDLPYIPCSKCSRRRATLWCPGCILAFCPNCWGMVPHHNFLGTAELWSPGREAMGSRSKSAFLRSRSSVWTDITYEEELQKALAGAAAKPGFNVMMGPTGELVPWETAIKRNNTRSKSELLRGMNFAATNVGHPPQYHVSDFPDKLKQATIVYDNDYIENDRRHLTQAQRYQQLDKLHAYTKAKQKEKDLKKNNKSRSSMAKNESLFKSSVDKKKTFPPVQTVSTGAMLSVDSSHKSRLSVPLAGISSEYFPEDWEATRVSRKIGQFKGVSVYTSHKDNSAKLLPHASNVGDKVFLIDKKVSKQFSVDLSEGDNASRSAVSNGQFVNRK